MDCMMNYGIGTKNVGLRFKNYFAVVNNIKK